MRKNIIKNLIKKEIRNLKSDPNYWGSEKNVNNENTIYNYFLIFLWSREFNNTPTPRNK